MRRAAALSVAALGLSLVLGAAPAHAEPSAAPVTLTVSRTAVAPGEASPSPDPGVTAPRTPVADAPVPSGTDVSQSSAADASQTPVADASQAPGAGTTTSATAEASLGTGAGAPSAVPSAAVDPGLDPAGGDAGTGRHLLIVAGAALAAAAGIGVWLMLTSGGRRTEYQRRLDSLRRFTDVHGTVPDEARFTAQTRLVLGILHRLDARLTAKQRAALELSVERAGVALDPAEWLLVRIAITVVSTVALGALLGSWFGLPVGALAGWVCCGQWLAFRAGRRSRAFTDQLPDSLRLMVGALRSGFTLNQAIDAVVREGQAPVSTELGRAMAETRLGDDLENALDRVGERNNNPDMGWIVMAIRIQREVGGNLSEVLETAVHTMRERAKLGRHVRALSAEGRLSGIILFSMPFAIAAVLMVLRPEYVRPLYTEPTGLLMIAVAAVLLTVGALWLRRLVEVKV